MERESRIGRGMGRGRGEEGQEGETGGEVFQAFNRILCSVKKLEAKYVGFGFFSPIRDQFGQETLVNTIYNDRLCTLVSRHKRVWLMKKPLMIIKTEYIRCF